MFLRRQLGPKSATSLQVMLLEVGVRHIEILVLQRVYRYVKKVKNMQNLRLPHVAWNVGVQKNHKQNSLKKNGS